METGETKSRVDASYVTSPPCTLRPPPKLSALFLLNCAAALKLTSGTRNEHSETDGEF